MGTMIDSELDQAIAHRLHSNLARSKAAYWQWRVDGHVAGWIRPARVHRLARFADVFVVRDEFVEFVETLATPEVRTAALDQVARTLAREGALSPWRDERYAAAPTFGAAPWFLLERAAARYFGIRSWAVHGNGMVEHRDGARMWLARRSPTKATDPDMLDNLVGGGVPAGFDLRAAFVKEAWEEAGLPPNSAQAAAHASTLHIARDTAMGLYDESIAIYDIALSREYVPANQDGEAVAHRCVSLPEAARLIALETGPDQVTLEASLVVLDKLVRTESVDPHGAAATALAGFRPGA